MLAKYLRYQILLKMLLMWPGRQLMQCQIRNPYIISNTQITMATQINLPVAVAVLALAIVGYSFFSGFQSYAVADANAVYGTPASSFCNDDDDINTKFQGNCTDDTGTLVEICSPSYSGSVNEYYCAPNNKCQSRRIRCGYKETCVEGACVAI